MAKISFADVCNLISIYSLMFLISGCGNPLGSHSEVDVQHNPGANFPETIPAGKGMELVSSSSQKTLTQTGKFIFSGTLSSPTDQLILRSNQLNYKVFSNVQGEILSGATGL